MKSYLFTLKQIMGVEQAKPIPYTESESVYESESDTVPKQTENQLFKTLVPAQFLWDFLKQNFEESPMHFQITKYLFSKSNYNQQMSMFTTALKPYYYPSKQKYIASPFTYKCFLTVIRQICKAHKITYETKLIYNKSTYEIEYSVYK